MHGAFDFHVSHQDVRINDEGNVFIIARGQKRLDAALDEIAAERNRAAQVCRAFSADVSQYEQIKAVGDAIAEGGHPPDILINSAGIARCNYFDELTLDDFRQTMNINFFGTVNTVKTMLPYMKERRSGHIVNISSMAGFLGVFGYTAYGASKFAVRGFSDVLRCELKPYGIHVSVVFPPDTDTPQLWAENETKPLETKMISGTVKPMSAAMTTGRPYLLPDSDSHQASVASGPSSAKNGAALPSNTGKRNSGNRLSNISTSNTDKRRHSFGLIGPRITA